MKTRSIAVLVGLPLALALACGDTQDPQGPGAAGTSAGAAGTPSAGTANTGGSNAGTASIGGSNAGTASIGGSNVGTSGAGGTEPGAGAGGFTGEAGAGGQDTGGQDTGGTGGATGHSGAGGDGSGGEAPDGPVSVLQAKAGDLVITEVMRNPAAVDDTVGEWFEVYNATEQALELAGLVLADGTGSVTVTGSLIVEPQAYVVFARNGGAGNGGEVADFVYGDVIQLSNGTDLVRISAASTLLDEVSYDAAGAFPALVGASMSFALATPSAVANDSATNWCVAGRRYGKGDLGSPGAPNSCPKAASALGPGDLVVTEIMANPKAVDDKLGEWFELYNPGLDAIDLEGLVVRDADVDSFSVASSLLAVPGARVVLAANGAGATNGGVNVAYVYAYSTFALANGADEIILGSDVVIDSVSFNASTFAAGTSISLSPTATSAPGNDEPTSWCSGTSVYGSGDYGTPGAANDACP